MNYIDPSVSLDSSVKVGYYSVMEKDDKVGTNVLSGNRVTIHEGTIIDMNTTIADVAILGRSPKRLKCAR